MSDTVTRPEFDQRKDWFNRRKEYGYVEVNLAEKTVDWEQDLEFLSDYILGNQRLETPRDASGILASMMQVLRIDPRSFTLTSKGLPAKDQIQIPSDLLKSDENLRKAATTFIGGSLHQLSKKGFFAPVEQSTMAEDERNVRENKADLGGILKSMLAQELTDRKLGSRYPGYAKFVGKYKEHLYENIEDQQPSDQAHERMMSLLGKLIRYPGTITEEEMTEFEKPIKEIKRLFSTYPGGFPKQLNACRELANKIRGVVVKYLSEPPEMPPPPPEGGSGDGQNPQGPGNDPPSPGMDKNQIDKAMSQFFQNHLKSGMLDSTDDQQDESLANEVLERLNLSNDDDEIQDPRFPVVFHQPLLNTKSDEEYQKLLKSVDLTLASTISTLMKRKSQNWEFIIRGMKSGKLDTSRLVEARQGVPTVYQRQGEVSTNRLTVGILVDESGSMAGDKIRSARTAAVFLYACFGKVPEVELFIYGHTADLDTRRNRPTTDITVYKEHGTPFRPANLTAMSAQDYNRDGVAILTVARKIRQQTQNQGILLVISDGMPNASDYRDNAAVRDTREKVLEAEKLGFQVVQIAIDSVDSHKMFKHYIPLKDMKTFPREMVAYLKRYLDKNIRQTIKY